MGGDTFPHLKTRRYSRDEYKKVYEFILEKFSKYFDKIEDTKSLPSKDSYGDIDLLYNSSSKVIDWNDIQKELESSVIAKSGPITSFAYKDEFQVDFIFCENYMWERFLMSYGGLFNLLGVCFRKNNMKLTQHGIYYIMRHEGKTEQYGTITLSCDYNKCMDFIELDPETFEKEFDTEEQLFEYIINSPFLLILNYEDENIGVRRNLIRPLQKKCIEWLTHEENKTRMKTFTKTPIEIMDFFEKREEYETEKRKSRERKIIRDKFNGKIVGELTGLTKQSLGDFIQYLKKNPDFESLVLTSKPEDVVEHILKTFRIYEQEQDHYRKSRESYEIVDV